MTESTIQIFDNFRDTLAHEEKLRAESLAIVESHPDWKKRLALVEKALSPIFAYTHDHTARDDDELTVQMLGIRIFNSSASSIKLALSGYYQTAFTLIRDIMETGFFWIGFAHRLKRFLSGRVLMIEHCVARFLRTRCERHSIREMATSKKKREQAYQILCKHAAHATYRGFRMTTQDGLGTIGPFVEPKNLQAWVEEMVLRVGPVAVLFAELFPNANPDFEKFRQTIGTELLQQVRKAPPSGS